MIFLQTRDYYFYMVLLSLNYLSQRRASIKWLYLLDDNRGMVNKLTSLSLYNVWPNNHGAFIVYSSCLGLDH